MPSPSTLIPLVLLTLNLLTPTSARLGHPLGGGPGGHGSVVKRASGGPHAQQQQAARSEIKHSGRKLKSTKKSTVKRDANGKRLVRKRKNSNCIPQSQFNVSTSAATSSYVAVPSSNPTSSTSSSAAYVTSSVSFVSNAQNLATGGATAGVSSHITSSATPSASVTTASTTSSASTPKSTSDWYLVEKWSGSTFFDNFNFWDYSDPTHGTVTYVSQSDAWNQGLVSINSQGHAIITVDQTPVVTGGRKSVRIHGNLVYTGGLVIMDAVHAPTGCGTWPAWWSNGPNWPYGGEIDIMEGINAFGQNQVSLHTGAGCTMPTNLNMQGQLTTGSYDSYDCASYNTANQGCGVRDQTNDNGYGAGFNSAGGGVYAMEWALSGINVYFFTRNSIPADITNGSPNPAGWGTPIANFPSTNCNPYQYFYDHFNIFDTTFCGDWAGASSVWDWAGYAGQSQSCASMTGYSTCADYVLNNGAAFSQAYWEIAYVAYYNSTTLV